MSKITVPLELFEEMRDVCSWHKSLCNMIRDSEIYDLHPDQGSFDYLEGRAEAVREMATDLLESAQHRVQADGLRSSQDESLSGRGHGPKRKASDFNARR
jgi:hypothetical protein